MVVDDSEAFPVITLKTVVTILHSFENFLEMSLNNAHLIVSNRSPTSLNEVLRSS